MIIIYICIAFNPHYIHAQGYFWLDKERTVLMKILILPVEDFIRNCNDSKVKVT